VVFWCVCARACLRARVHADVCVHVCAPVLYVHVIRRDRWLSACNYRAQVYIVSLSVLLHVTIVPIQTHNIQQHRQHLIVYVYGIHFSKVAKKGVKAGDAGQDLVRRVAAVADT
jgi:hypothetical protein